jgi:hypothetical protein
VNHIHVVLSSILPVAVYPWRKEIQPIEKIAALSNWMKGFAAGRGVVYLDYYSALVGEHHGMKAGLSEDGVHPNKAGYAVMQSLAARAIKEALSDHPKPALATGLKPLVAALRGTFRLCHPNTGSTRRMTALPGRSSACGL